MRGLSCILAALLGAAPAAANSRTAAPAVVPVAPTGRSSLSAPVAPTLAPITPSLTLAAPTARPSLTVPTAVSPIAAAGTPNAVAALGAPQAVAAPSAALPQGSGNAIAQPTPPDASGRPTLLKTLSAPAPNLSGSLGDAAGLAGRDFESRAQLGASVDAPAAVGMPGTQLHTRPWRTSLERVPVPVENERLITEVIASAGLSAEIQAPNVTVVAHEDSTRQFLIDRLNGAIERFMAERGPGAKGPLSGDELKELIGTLTRDHRATIDTLIKEFDDPAKSGANVSIGLGGKLGQPTIFINGWAKGKPSRMHDHGASKAAYHIYRGTLKERLLERKPGGKFQLTESVFREGETAAAAPPYVHQLESANEDAARTVTINGYSPHLVLMNRYDFRDGRWVNGGQWLDDEVVHEVKTARAPDGALTVALEQSALDDWRADENTFPGYLRNALALTLLYSALEGRGFSPPELIKKGYTIETLNELYAGKRLDGDAIFRIIERAGRLAFEAGAPQGRLTRLKDIERLK
ncbi:MAG: hypothetical protein HYZ75_14780 [Elusimicrobia bacterium]|nr:hypothetical protein [Elusimicrobiota bacterium]